MTAPTASARPPLYRDVRVLKWVVQLVVLAVVLAVVWWLWGNYTRNADRQNIPTSLTFLDNPATFQITGNSAVAERAGARRHDRGPAEHAARRRGRDRAGDRARHDRRHRPAEPELDRRQAVRGLRRGRPQHPAAAVPPHRLPRHRARRVPEHHRGVAAARAGGDLQPRHLGPVVRGLQPAAVGHRPGRRRSAPYSSPSGAGACRPARARRRGRGCGRSRCSS